MKVLKQLFNFYINSSIHVALAVVSLACVTFFEFDISVDKATLLFLFFSSITGYNFVKFFGLVKFHHRSLTNWLKYVQVFSFFSFVFMCFFAFEMQMKTLLSAIGFGTVTFFYAIPFLPKDWYVGSKSSLRTVSGLKIYLIAITWSGVTVLLPLIENDCPINMDALITSIQRFALVIVFMLPFEIRDLRYDSLALATVPQKIGVKRTKQLGILLLVFVILSEFFKDETSVRFIIPLVAICMVTALFVLFSKMEQGKYYSSFWVEALPILWLGLLLFFFRRIVLLWLCPPLFSWTLCSFCPGILFLKF
ncbi:hypothetical protein WJN01_01320 [Flavobacteriaceae bacterium SZ-1-7]|uniref:hypothetical protein n=1 Tax=Tamlana sedimenti TaxID=3134126 RepID=UPI003122451F